MLIKPVLPVLALLSIVGNGVVSAAESEVSSAKAFKDSAKASKVSSAKAAKSEGSETSSAKAFKDDGKASKLAKSEAAVVDAKAEKVSKASKSKVGKMFKSKKQGSKASGAAPSAPTTATPLGEDPSLYRSEFLDPSFWHPATSNFEIIDWERWEACDHEIPFMNDPPFRENFSQAIFDQNPFKWGRIDNLPEEVIATGAKPSIGYVTDPEYGLFYGILGQAPESSLIPEPFRNKLLWTQENVGAEYLNSFNRAAWRHNTPEGRVTGLFLTGTDYTGATHETAFAIADRAFKNQFVNFQVSPNGKWIKFYNIPDDPTDSTIDSNWFDMYIVQEGDEFTDRDGNVLDWVKAGDIYRLEFGDKKDPYHCKDVTYEYFMRTVATIDEETGVITPEYPHYDALIDTVTNEPPEELKEATSNWTDSSSMSGAEKWDFLTDYEPDRQMYLSSPLPPPASMLDDL
jgi:hypothetical protein